LCKAVDGANHLKCQLLEHLENLADISDQFNQLCEKTLAPKSLEIGLFILAKLKEDERWYRAKVLKVDSPNVHVHFIDLEKHDTVQLDNTRLLRCEFSALPRAVVDVQLHDVHTTDIDVEACKKWLNEKLIEKTIRVDVVSFKDNLAEVQVFLDNEESSVNDQIYHNFAIHADSTPLLEDLTIESIADTTSTSEFASIKDFTQTSICPTDISGVEPLSSTINSESVISYPKPQVNSSEKVLCTYVASSTTLSFQLLRDEPILNNITELLVETPAQVLAKEMLQIGRAVIAQSVDDGNWYRAEIKSISSTEIGVFFIDFGNSEIVPPSNIRDVFDVRFMQPATCITCNLDKVANVDEEKAKDWLEENCIDNIFNAEVLDRSKTGGLHSVTICFEDKKGIASVNEIVQTQFASSSTPTTNGGGPMKGKVEWVKGQAVKTTIDSHKTKWMILEKECHEQVTCVGVTDAQTLSFQLVRFSKRLDKLMSDISNKVEDLSGVRFLEKGTPCIAQYSDLNWYRAIVLEPRDGFATVKFIDFGNIDDVILEDIRVSPGEMLEEPVFCVECRLDGVDIPKENREDATEYLVKTLVEDSPEVLIKIVDLNNETHSADVVLIQEGQNINQFFQNHYGALDSVLRECNVKLFEKIQITIPPTKQLTNFWCMLNDTKDQREEMVKSLSEKYSSTTAEVPERLELEQPCCFLSNNGQWYRGSIKAIEESNVDVFAVDYGFTETCSSTDVRTLLSEFFKLSAQGFVCSLFDLRPYKNSDGWSTDAVDFFNKACENDVLTATILNCNNQVCSVALTKSNGDTIYELLSNQNFAETNNRKLSNEDSN